MIVFALFVGFFIGSATVLNGHSSNVEIKSGYPIQIENSVYQCKEKPRTIVD